MKMAIDLSDRVALITGATRDLGKHYSQVLSEQGAHVIVSGRDQAAINGAVSAIEQTGGKASGLLLDMRDVASMQAKVDKLVQLHQRIDILINNAAISEDQEIFNIDEISWDKHLDTNLKGLFFLSQAIAKQMSQQVGVKKIINIAAVNGHKVRRNCVPFSISKAGVIHLTKLLAYELAPFNIQVNALALGLIASSGVQRYLEKDVTADSYLNEVPQKRVGQFQEITEALLLLVSGASNYMTGSVLPIDGGLSCDVFMHSDIHY